MSHSPEIAVPAAPMKKGGAPGSDRPIQDLTMLNVLDRALQSKDQQTVTDFLEEGFVTISAVDMNRILNECGFEFQRPVSERHMLVLADLMARGQWQPKSQIDFAVLNGRYILINGYHRAYAQVRSGKTITWSVVFHKVKTAADLRSLYFTFDTNVRMRGSHEILRASEFATVHGLSATTAEALYRAVPYIASKFETNPKNKDFLIAKAVDRRLELASDYAKAAAKLGACIEGMSPTRRIKFKGGALTAVAVITFRYQSDTAWQFWTGVAQNDGLKRGDPRQALVNDMMTRKAGGTHLLAFAPAMVAWNAYFNERELRLIKVFPDTFTPAIDGTPFNGR